MPSYAHDVKSELALKFDDDPQCLRAELVGMLRVGATSAEERIDFENANAAVVRKIIVLIKKIYPDAQTEIAAIRKKNLRKSMRYAVRIFLTEQTEEFFRNIASSEISRRRDRQVAYLRGAFLAAGTVNRPEKHYYLDFSSLCRDAVENINRLLRSLHFNSGFRVRHDEFVAYMNESDSIYEFLGMIGADTALDRFDSARNLKDIRANVNRIMNCDSANMNKIINAAQRQLADIRLLQEHNVKVREILREAMQVRLDFPECTIGEIAEKVYVSRTALMQRFKQIHALAEEIRRQS